ncbi:hypothetical protein [Psychroserpens sp.]
MKKVIIICILLFVFFSCKVKKNSSHQNSIINIVKQKSYDDYILCEGISTTKDTIMFIVSKEKLKKCGIQKVDNVKLDNVRQVKYLKSGRDSIHFKYKVTDLNGQYEFFAGAKPGDDKEYIYSYYSYPYMVNKCKDLNQ